MIANNRISGLLDDAPVSAPLPRSPAQRRASRRNGARSRGPVTVAGKARSRLNALKHGLLARLVVPPGDHRMHDRMYWKIHRQLMAEFRPRTFTQRMLVDTLASDFLQLGRAREMVEAYVQPRPLVERDETQYRQLEDTRRDHRFLRALSIGLDTRRVPICGRRQALRIAETMVSTIKAIEANLKEVAAEMAEGYTAGTDGNVSEAEDDPFEREELRIERELCDAVGGTRGKFSNTG